MPAAPRKPSGPPPAWVTPSPDRLSSVVDCLAEREHYRRSVMRERRLGDSFPGAVGAQEGAQDDDGGESWYRVEVGASRNQLHKNRYGDIIAYDRTRCLPPLRTTAANEQDYVNASLVREPDLGFGDDVLPRRWWVAAQAPIPDTVHDFLSLLLTPPTSLAYQSSASSAAPAAAGQPRALPLVNLIVQLTPLVEGRRQKCHPYFPSAVGQTWDLPSASGERGQGVWVRLERKDERDGARTSELRVGREGDSEGRKVLHVEYLGWRDHGVPDSPSHLVRFIHRIHAHNASFPGPRAPILAHCSAGVGRTGTLIALSSLLPLLSHLSSAAAVDLPLPPEDPSHPLGAYPAHRMLAAGSGPDYVGATVDALRDQRTTMCQTGEQVAWVFEALGEAWREGLVGPRGDEEGL
ncbi:tyrosine-protein phosphatase [Rhodotorula paludigena]|uniref:tyrosine-protein phosphatase n=1 Tax=Rhodotorula paludigena TaxID=86838 RepID=UPI00317F8D06